MKRKTAVVVLGVLTAVALAGWVYRFDIALGHVRTRLAEPRGGPLSLAWSILGDFAGRPEVETFVREQLHAVSRPAVDDTLPSGFDPAPLLDLTRQVYERQPERVDAAVVAAGLTVECLHSCAVSQEYPNPPAFTTSTWPVEIQSSTAFRSGMRAAAIALSNYVPGTGSWSRTHSHAALVTAVAATGTAPDDELADVVAAYVLAANPDDQQLRWLSAAVERAAGPHRAAAAWAQSMARAPETTPEDRVWTTIVDTLRGAPVLPDDAPADAIVQQCVRRSRPPAVVDEACIDLGLAWSSAWASRLRTAVAAEAPEASGARALLTAHERERTRTWQSVIAGWREAPTVSDEPSRQISTWQYGPPSARRNVREAALLLAATPEALPHVAALYRTSGNPEVINDAIFVLAQRSPQQLSAAVISTIDRFRLLPAPTGLERVDALRSTQAVDYDLEARRVAAGLLALEREGRSSTRIHPLILALSIPDPEFSKRASQALRSTLDAGEFADALFGFLAVRERYLVSEVDVYRNALVSYEGSAPAIERNLERLLAKARGIPERVPWILKVIGVAALGEVGNASARPLLEQYARDTGSYLYIQTRAGRSRATEDAETRRFDELAAQALESIGSREALADFGRATGTLTVVNRPESRTGADGDGGN